MNRVSFDQGLFAESLGESARRRLGSAALLHNFEDGEFLYHVGRPAERLWLVASGGVRTLRTQPNGRTTVLESLGPGEPFGLAAVIPGSPHAETAEGVGDGTAWFVSRDTLFAALASDAALAQALLPIVARRLQGAHDRLFSFAHESVTSRMAHELLEADDGLRIETTRRGLAEAVGTTVETAIRVLRRFERSGWIEAGVGWVRVVEPGRLADVARGAQFDS